MARKTALDKIYPRDMKALGVLAKVGHASQDQLHEFVRDKRLYTYEKAGLIGRVPYNRPGDRDRDQICYRLTRAGREFCRNELHFSDMYKAQSVAHDMGLADRFFALTPTERDSWLTESQVRDMYQQYIDKLRDQGEEETAKSLWDSLESGQVSPPDGCYTADTGEQVVVEVVTNNYGEAEIQEKINFVENMGVSWNSFDFIRI